MDFILRAALAKKAGMTVAEYSRLATPEAAAKVGMTVAEYSKGVTPRAAASASHVSVLKKLAGGGLEVRIPSNNPLQQHLAGMEGRSVGPESLLRQAIAGGNRGPVRPPMRGVKQSNTNLDLARQRILEDLPGSRNPAYDPATKTYATVADHYAAKGTELQKGRFVRGTPPARAKASVAPETKSTTTSPTNKAAAGSEVGSKQAADITGYAGSMMGGLAAVGVGAGVGGVTSYATGGEFGKGAVAGGMVAGGAYLGMSTMATNAKAINAAAGGEGFGAGVMGAMQGANQVIGGASVAGRRAALMGGAGLAGLTFGGNRRSHRRGFNQSRGSRI